MAHNPADAMAGKRKMTKTRTKKRLTYLILPRALYPLPFKAQRLLYTAQGKLEWLHDPCLESGAI
jgi:hypothetical protein